MKKPLRPLLWAALLPLTACTASRPVNSALQTEPEYCVPPLAYRYDPVTAPLLNIAPLLDSALTARFPRRSLLVANAAGALPQLKELAIAQIAASGRPRPRTGHPAPGVSPQLSSNKAKLLEKMLPANKREPTVDGRGLPVDEWEFPVNEQKLPVYNRKLPVNR